MDSKVRKNSFAQITIRSNVTKAAAEISVEVAFCCWLDNFHDGQDADLATNVWDLTFWSGSSGWTFVDKVTFLVLSK